jgi:glycosyltransferase involved in cell wall biosynthesis
MKALILSATDIQGGAARASYRLHQGLKGIDVDCQMLVQTKYGDDPKVLGTSASSGIGSAMSGLRLTLDRLPLKSYSHNSQSSYSVPWLPDRLLNRVNQIAPDVVNLHWINSGYLNIETIAKLNRPLVWTLHDMWAFTGGCHYNQECDHYTNSCGTCPQISSDRSWDISRWVWHRKAKAWRDINMTIVSPSYWLAKCALSSSLFRNLRVEVIPNGIDTQKYRPINKYSARDLLNLPQDKKLILFGALRATSDVRKGFNLLQAALKKLSESNWKEKIEIVIFGASQPDKLPDFGFKVHYLGLLNDDFSLALLYSAADIFVAPSTQDNLPNTLVEAIACGTPCVGFNIGGIPDIVEHEKNGYLAKPYQVEDFACGIAWTVENEERYQKLSNFARQKAEKVFALPNQAQQYLSLFNDILLPNKMLA